MSETFRKLLRLRAMLLALVLAVFMLATDAAAGEAVPPTLIARLAMKVASYDKKQPERQRTRPRILVVEDSSNELSVRVATMVAQSLREPDVGRDAPVEIVSFTTAASLAAMIDTRAASIVVLTVGLEDSMSGISASLAGKDVLAIGTTGALAERGAVVGFELREGKPKIVVNQSSARRQNVEFKAELLALARIVQ